MTSLKITTDDADYLIESLADVGLNGHRISDTVVGVRVPDDEDPSDTKFEIESYADRFGISSIEIIEKIGEGDIAELIANSPMLDTVRSIAEQWEQRKRFIANAVGQMRIVGTTAAAVSSTMNAYTGYLVLNAYSHRVILTALATLYGWGDYRPGDPDARIRRVRRSLAFGPIPPGKHYHHP